MKLWIARDKDGSLYLWRNKPVRQNDEERFMYGGYTGELIQDLYPEVTWENSPQEMELVSKEEYKRLKEIEKTHKKEGGPGDWYII